LFVIRCSLLISAVLLAGQSIPQSPQAIYMPLSCKLHVQNSWESFSAYL
jgi:hypothetical protein